MEQDIRVGIALPSPAVNIGMFLMSMRSGAMDMYIFKLPMLTYKNLDINFITGLEFSLYVWTVRKNNGCTALDKDEKGGDNFPADHS